MAAPTHTTRVGHTWKSGGDVFLYTIILLFNTAMTFTTKVWNDRVNDLENIKLQDICSGLNMEGSGAMALPITDLPNRIAAYCLFLIYYTLIAGAVVFLDLVFSIKKHGCLNCFRVIPSVVANVFLLVAGILYLAGDNILLLFRTYSNETAGGPANDLRSYIVAIALAFMIMSNVILSLGNSVYEHCGARKDEGNIVLAEFNTKSSKGGEDGKPPNWDLFYPNESVESALMQRTAGLKKHEGDKKYNLRLTLTNPAKESVDLELKVSEKLASSGGTLQLVMANDQSHADESTDLLLSSYSEITSKSHSTLHIHTRKKYIYAILADFFRNMLRFTLIADALYTTILDEITHQSTEELEGCSCRDNALGVAHAVFWTLTAFWVAYVSIQILIAGCTYSLYKPRHRCLPSYFNTNLCSCCDAQRCLTQCGWCMNCTCWDTECTCCTKWLCCQVEENQDWHAVPDKILDTEFADSPWYALLFYELPHSIEPLLKIGKKYSEGAQCLVNCCACCSGTLLKCPCPQPECPSKCTCRIVDACVISSLVFLAITIGLPVLALIIGLVLLFPAAFLIVAAVVGLIFLQTCGLCLFCYGQNRFRNSHRFKLHSKICDADCERSARYACRFLPHVFMAYLSVAVILFLPLYLIQDNKFPWVCYIHDKSSGSGELFTWNAARYIFLGVVTATTIVVSIINSGTVTFPREEKLRRLGPTRSHMAMPSSSDEVVTSQPTSQGKEKLIDNDNDSTSDSLDNINMEMMRAHDSTTGSDYNQHNMPQGPDHTATQELHQSPLTGPRDSDNLAFENSRNQMEFRDGDQPDSQHFELRVSQDLEQPESDSEDSDKCGKLNWVNSPASDTLN